MDAVFSGHDHIYERIKPQKGIACFVSGSAGWLRKGDYGRPQAFSATGFDRDFTFMLVEINGSKLYFQSISRTGLSIGDVPTTEVLAAADILRRELPELRLRMVNVTDLLILEKKSEHPHGLDAALFDAVFTPDALVIVNGYPSAVKQLLFGRGIGARFAINGYREEGNTTTPFDMLVRNGVSRYHLVAQAIRAAAPRNPRVAIHASERVLYYEYLLRNLAREIWETGQDPEAIREWKWAQ